MTNSQTAAAVLVHEPSETLAFCRECGWDRLPTDHETEQVPPRNVGTVLECDGCGINIQTTIDDDDE